jgi:molybdenum cofactor cytidylyltransferase
MRELTQTNALIVYNECWRSGIGTSIRTGVRHLIESAFITDAVVLLTCDQPFVSAGTIKKLIALRKEASNGIVASSYGDTLGIPVLFDRPYFKELLALSDDRGAKEVVLKNREFVEEFSFPAGKIDIDTVEDYEQFVAVLGGST